MTVDMYPESLSVNGHDEFLQSVLDALQHPFYVIDARDYTVIMANQAGRTEGMTENAKCHKLIHHSDFPCEGREHPCLLEKVKITKTDAVVEHIHYDIDGRLQNVEVHVHPILGDGGEVVQIIEYCIDITARKNAEHECRRLFTAIEQSADVVAITDTGGIIQYVNPVVEKVTGYSREELTGKKTSVFKSGRHPDSFYKQMWDTILSGAVWQGRLINKRKNGDLYEEEMSISPVKDEFGAIVNFVALKCDTSKRSLLEKAQEYFSVIASHELRTPLTKLEFVKHLFFRVEQGVTDKNDMRELNFMLDGAISDFKRIVDATSVFAELASARAIRPFHEMDIRLIVQYCSSFAREMARKEKRNIIIETDLGDADDELWIMCEQSLMIGAIEEMLSNAVKFTPDGKKIFVTLRRVERFAEIKITDEGVGIPLENLEHVYKPYFSLEDHYSHSTGRYKFQGGGIGIGLSIAKLVMEYHNGSISLYSDGAGTGTMVTLALPLQ